MFFSPNNIFFGTPEMHQRQIVRAKMKIDLIKKWIASLGATIDGWFFSGTKPEIIKKYLCLCVFAWNDVLLAREMFLLLCGEGRNVQNRCAFSGIKLNGGRRGQNIREICHLRRKLIYGGGGCCSLSNISFIPLYGQLFQREKIIPMMYHEMERSRECVPPLDSRWAILYI